MDRVYHTWDKWECYPAGFYDSTDPAGRTATEARQAYADFLSNDDSFRAALARVLDEWPMSCEHYLTNENMNRLAWLGQAAACVALGLPRAFRGVFNLLSKVAQDRANDIALDALNAWLGRRGEPLVPNIEAAQSKTQMELY